MQITTDELIFRFLTLKTLNCFICMNNVTFLLKLLIFVYSATLYKDHVFDKKYFKINQQFEIMCDQLWACRYFILFDMFLYIYLM